MQKSPKLNFSREIPEEILGATSWKNCLIPIYEFTILLILKELLGKMSIRGFGWFPKEILVWVSKRTWVDFWGNFCSNSWMNSLDYLPQWTFRVFLKKKLLDKYLKKFLKQCLLHFLGFISAWTPEDRLV